METRKTILRRLRAGLLLALLRAVEARLVRERVAAYLTWDEGAAEVRAEVASAQRLGVQAVPTFVFSGRLAVRMHRRNPSWMTSRRR